MGELSIDSTLHPVMENAWFVPKLLSDQECDTLKDRALEIGFDERAKRDDRHRTSRTVVFQDDALASAVWERIKDQIPREIVINADHPPPGVEHDPNLQGRWIAKGLNPHWRVAIYDVGGHFGPHRDAPRIEGLHRRSFITINGYLTALPENSGGATRFLRNDHVVYLDEATGRYAPVPGSVLHKVEDDCAGKAVVFFHDFMHDGEPLNPQRPEAQKWLYRSEVMYERDLTSPLTPQMTAEQWEAREYLHSAVKMEEAGNISAATQAYRKAYRLDPSLE